MSVSVIAPITMNTNLHNQNHPYRPQLAPSQFPPLPSHSHQQRQQPVAAATAASAYPHSFMRPLYQQPTPAAAAATSPHLAAQMHAAASQYAAGAAAAYGAPTPYASYAQNMPSSYADFARGSGHMSARDIVNAQTYYPSQATHFGQGLGAQAPLSNGQPHYRPQHQSYVNQGGHLNLSSSPQTIPTNANAFSYGEKKVLNRDPKAQSRMGYAGRKFAPLKFGGTLAEREETVRTKAKQDLKTLLEKASNDAKHTDFNVGKHHVESPNSSDRPLAASSALVDRKPNGIGGEKRLKDTERSESAFHMDATSSSSTSNANASSSRSSIALNAGAASVSSSTSSPAPSAAASFSKSPSNRFDVDRYKTRRCPHHYASSGPSPGRCPAANYCFDYHEFGERRRDPSVFAYDALKCPHVTPPPPGKDGAQSNNEYLSAAYVYNLMCLARDPFAFAYKFIKVSACRASSSAALNAYLLRIWKIRTHLFMCCIATP